MFSCIRAFQVLIFTKSIEALSSTNVVLTVEPIFDTRFYRLEWHGRKNSTKKIHMILSVYVRFRSFTIFEKSRYSKMK